MTDVDTLQRLPFTKIPPDELRELLARAATRRAMLEAALPLGALHRTDIDYEVLALPPATANHGLAARLAACGFQPVASLADVRAMLGLPSVVTDAWTLWFFPAWDDA